MIPENTDIDRAVAERLAPFAESATVTPWKRYLTRDEIAAMAKRLRARRTSLRRLAGMMEHWTGEPGGVDDRGLFALTTRNPKATWGWYEIGGCWNGFLPGNVLTCQSLLQSPDLRKLLPHDFLGLDGIWHTRDRYVSARTRVSRVVRTGDRKWLAEFREFLKAPEGGLVVCVDRHM